MAQTSILDLVTAYKHEQIHRPDFEAALEQQIQQCRRKQEELDKARIQPEDQEVWAQDLRPGLEACYEGLIGAASEALEYARSRDEALLTGIVGLLQEVERIGAYLEARSGLVSEATREQLHQSLDSDALALGASQGKAESEISFLEE